MRAASWDVVPVALALASVIDDTLRGSDGSSTRDRGVFHLTVLADGTVTVALDSFALVCG
jgi:hypothetical protein